MNTTLNDFCEQTYIEEKTYIVEGTYINITNKTYLEIYKDNCEILEEFYDNYTYIYDEKQLNIINNNCEKKIKNEIPKHTKKLFIRCIYNQKIKKNVLPNNLQQLTFGDNFNQKIKKDILPNNLQQLTFGWYFNQKIKKNVLPNFLQQLTFSKHFNQKIKKIGRAHV